ncbi:hypothetical protein V8D89_006732 [Ganoderma adspersum]
MIFIIGRRTDSTLDHLIVFALSTGLVTFIWMSIPIELPGLRRTTHLLVRLAVGRMAPYFDLGYTVVHPDQILNSRRALGIMASSKKGHGVNSSSGLGQFPSMGQPGIPNYGHGDTSTETPIQIKIVPHNTSKTHSDFDEGKEVLPRTHTDMATSV